MHMACCGGCKLVLVSLRFFCKWNNWKRIQPAKPAQCRCSQLIFWGEREGWGGETNNKLAYSADFSFPLFIAGAFKRRSHRWMKQETCCDNDLAWENLHFICRSHQTAYCSCVCVCWLCAGYIGQIMLWFTEKEKKSLKTNSPEFQMRKKMSDCRFSEPGTPELLCPSVCLSKSREEIFHSGRSLWNISLKGVCR